ncbi:biotin--[acetyl-CoA-carboxylase] ligase [Criibacterium bergeronii]|uniref:Bifunctional ligase/repressor BirA n=1 Tax=Criibacterium bergeronii TaxID=1871336 RepID=A0A371IN15_9FIRM|nr:biotin--[acetyl-CoA-carboxylase] ligase [Criibacterium bergeronii]MBS6062526.1 biotin--[acetyl-CoA-carboxylase] ligase [Peptostreptococcaceae bacterium]RDY21883.1 biotin--[acetyl-CoA-carboxylase] ligase [Criibacterium bergeronii]
MKNSDILKILSDHNGQYVSGAEMASIFGISRAALSKRIQKMKENGIKIDAITNKGYMLLDIPDDITQDNIYVGVADGQKIGNTIIVLDKVNSTNDYAKTIAKTSTEGTVIVSKIQTSGKGRRGREFISSEGGLYFTIILKPDVEITKIPFLTQVTACSVFKTLETLGVKTKIKWPNDIILNDKKLCGILCEMSMEIGMLDYCVVGIGINVENKFTDGIKDIATSLGLENYNISKKEILWQVLKYFDMYYKDFLAENYSSVLEVLRTNSNILGEKINILSAEITTPAVAKNIDDKGFLVVEYEDGTTEALNYGEISIRKR